MAVAHALGLAADFQFYRAAEATPFVAHEYLPFGRLDPSWTSSSPTWEDASSNTSSRSLPRRWASDLHRHLQPAFERQGHGPQTILSIFNKIKELTIATAGLGRIVGHHNRAAAQMRRDQFDRGAGHLGPDVHQYE